MVVRHSISADRLCQYISDLHASVRLRSNSHKYDVPSVCHFIPLLLLRATLFIYIFFWGGGLHPSQSRLSSAVGFMETAISFVCLQTANLLHPLMISSM